MIAQRWFPIVPGEWTSYAVHYGVCVGIGGAATALEIMYLYWDCLRSSRLMTEIAGHPHLADPRSCDETCLGMVRASLEMTDCRRPFRGIDPMTERRKWVLILLAITYKLKISVTRFVARIILRRLVGRLAGRSLIEVVAIPIYTLWNSLVCLWMMRQARVRALGPHLVESALEALCPDGVDAMPLEQQSACLMAMRKVALQTGAFHPNVRLLLQRYLEQTSYPVETLLQHHETLDAAVMAATPGQRRVILEFFALGAALEGAITRRNRRYLKALQRSAGEPPADDRLDAYLRFVLDGDSVTEVYPPPNTLGSAHSTGC